MSAFDARINKLEQRLTVKKRRSVFIGMVTKDDQLADKAGTQYSRDWLKNNYDVVVALTVVRP